MLADIMRQKIKLTKEFQLTDRHGPLSARRISNSNSIQTLSNTERQDTL